MRRLLPLLFASGCTDVCSSEITEVTREPGSDRYAVTEVRNCGATTDFATVIRVGRASEPQSSAREVFVADTDHGAARGKSNGAVWTSVTWTSPGRLQIDHAARARIFKRVTMANGAAITFRVNEPYESPPVP